MLRRRVVPAVDDAAVGLADAEADFGFLVDQHNAQPVARQLAGNGAANDSGADDNDVTVHTPPYHRPCRSDDEQETAKKTIQLSQVSEAHRRMVATEVGTTQAQILPWQAVVAVTGTDHGARAGDGQPWRRSQMRSPRTADAKGWHGVPIRYTVYGKGEPTIVCCNGLRRLHVLLELHVALFRCRAPRDHLGESRPLHQRQAAPR